MILYLNNEHTLATFEQPDYQCLQYEGTLLKMKDAFDVLELFHITTEQVFVELVAMSHIVMTKYHNIFDLNNYDIFVLNDITYILRKRNYSEQ